jgi:hypothetical protein
MKKLLFILIVTFAVSILKAENINVQTARKTADGFVNSLHLKSSVSDSPSNSFTVKKNGKAVFYIFNLIPQGFIIVSANDAAPPVLGYSIENNYSDEVQPENFSGWIQGYADQINILNENNIAPTEGNSAQWKALLNAGTSRSSSSVTTVGPLLTCTWNQGAPYNYLCPADGAGPGGHVYAGCVATAMSQVMYYWRFPNSGTGSHGYTWNPYGYLFADFGNTTYHWEQMSNVATSPNFEMAQLQSHLGIAVDMMYSATGSGAYSTDAAEALKTNFGYDQSLELVYRDNYSYEDWKELLRDQLDASHPMYYHGFGTGGHAFNVDGYQDTMYFHFNWGWGGSYNGYFHLFNLNPGGNSFSEGQGAIINFIPAGNNNVVQCNETDTLTSLTGSLEDGSGPVWPYFNNSACGWLIQPNDTLESIKLFFDRFDLEPGKDFLNVYDGTNNYSPLLGSFTGNTIPPVLTATSGTMYIKFITDGNGTSNGWQASYNAKPAPFCSSNTTTITGISGNLSDGSGSYDYRNKSLCRYKLLPTDAKSISLTFNYFDTKDQSDFLEIYNLETQTLLYKLYGQNNPGTLNFDIGKLYLLFITDSENTATGWDFSYTSSSLTGVNKNNLVNISVYPNPAQNQLNVRVPDVADGYVLKIIQTDGTVVYSESSDLSGNLNSSIDVSALSRGFYILQVNTSKGSGYYKVVLK